MYCTFVEVIKTLRKTLKLIQKFHQSSSCFCFSVNSAKYGSNQYTYFVPNFFVIAKQHCNIYWIIILIIYMTSATKFCANLIEKIMIVEQRSIQHKKTKVAFSRSSKETKMTNIEYLQTYVYNHAMSKFDSITSDFVRGCQICR